MVVTPWSLPAVYPPSTVRACPVIEDIIRQKKGRSCGDLFGPSEASQLVLGHGVGLGCLQTGPVKDGPGHRRIDEAGVHGVDPDATAGVVDGHALGQKDHAPLEAL